MSTRASQRKDDMKQGAIQVDEKLLRKKDVASLLACAGRTVDRLVNVGRLARVKVMGAMRFRLSQVQAIIEGGAL